jgi:hypothetical protein
MCFSGNIFFLINIKIARLKDLQSGSCFGLGLAARPRPTYIYI